MKMGKRPKFNEMVEEIRNGNITHVFVYDITRLSRNLGDFQVIYELITQGKLTLILVRAQEKYDLISPEKFLNLAIQTTCAHTEILSSNDKVKKGIRAKCEQGFRPCNTPYGYENVKKDNLAVVVERKSKMVIRAFELAEIGKYSLSEISDKLLEDGHKYHSKNGKVPTSTLINWLHNIFYTGYYVVKQTGEIVKGNHTPIITQEQFENVQKIYGDDVPRRPRRQFLFSTLVQLPCGHCLICDEKTKKNGQTYRYYSCKCKKEFQQQNGCSKKLSFSETQLLDELANCLKEIRLSLIPRELIKNSSQEIFSRLKKRLGELNHSESVCYSKIRKLEEQIADLEISDEEYISKRRQELELEHSEMEQKAKLYASKISEYDERCRNIFCGRLYDFFTTCNVETKRKLLELITEKFYVKNQKMKISLKPQIRNIRSRERVK